MIRTRFAPSPTGPLHLGHAYSAIISENVATKMGGEFFLRIEDLDQSRARPHWEEQIYQDLHWLGVNWTAPVIRQSDRSMQYQAALQKLWDLDLLYPCTCTRKDIKNAAQAPQEGDSPPVGPDGVIYPGTCRHKPRSKNIPNDVALRLNMKNAHSIEIEFRSGRAEFPEHITTQKVTPEETIATVGDPVLARTGMSAAYHLAVVVDDAETGITHITRGQDLFDATKIHVVVQNCLGLATPIYLHHDLIRDEHGKRLAKRDDSKSIEKFRSEGYTPTDIRKTIGF